jgi:hypothetical protein
MPLTEIYNYIKNFDGNTYCVFTQKGNEPKESDLAAFESRVGFRLPDEFREYALNPLGGLYMEVKRELWPRPQKGQVGPFWSFLYGVMVYSFTSEAPEWMQINTAWQRLSQDGYPQLVPFLKIIGDPDPYCFTADQQIAIWQHETPDKLKPISGTFSEVVMREIRNLEARKARKLRGEDKQRS